MEFTQSPTTDLVLIAQADGVGRIMLNRPQAINALNTAMCVAIQNQLDAWRDDPSIAEVEIVGVGERGLCSGGDVRQVRQDVIDGDEAAAFGFFRTEYAMNATIASYPKPYRAHMRGVTMGGGLGVSAHGTQRLVYADAKIAMPETIIGFFPDVGICWQLSRARNNLGIHVALTGCTLNAADAILLGLADRMAPGEALTRPTLVEGEWLDCYEAANAADIIAALENHPSDEAHVAAAAIRQRSPLSVCVALEAIRRACRLDSVGGVLEQDLVLARNSLTNPDFLEGVRAQLVDKDRTPTWRHARIEDVNHAEVLAMFVGGEETP